MLRRVLAVHFGDFFFEKISRPEYTLNRVLGLFVLASTREIE